jgi:hypothetical protein
VFAKLFILVAGLIAVLTLVSIVGEYRHRFTANIVIGTGNLIAAIAAVLAGLTCAHIYTTHGGWIWIGLIPLLVAAAWANAQSAATLLRA